MSKPTERDDVEAAIGRSDVAGSGVLRLDEAGGADSTESPAESGGLVTRGPGVGDSQSGTVATGATTLRRVFAQACDALYRFIFFRVKRDQHAAEELLQEVCSVAVGHASVPKNAEECEAWLFGVAKNLIRKHWRTHGRGDVFSLERLGEAGRDLADRFDAGAVNRDVLSNRETYETLMLAVTSLPSHEQRMIYGYYFDGRSQVELAGELGVTVKTIESTLYRVRGRLRATLRDLERIEG